MSFDVDFVQYFGACAGGFGKFGAYENRQRRIYGTCMCVCFLLHKYIAMWPQRRKHGQRRKVKKREIHK
jgi:hypothetical protein